MFKLRLKILPVVIGLCLAGAATAYGAGGCSTTECHEGIANIKPDDHEMMRTIKMNGSQHGDPDGCVMCHGGNPKATKKEEAHKGVPPTLRIAPVLKSSILIQDQSGSPITPAVPVILVMFIAQNWD